MTVIATEPSTSREDPRIARTRVGVLRAAAEIFEEQGWDAVTHSTVALRSGFARTTIYRYWPDRLDLLRDAILQRIERDEVLVTGDPRVDLIANLSAISTRIAAPSTRRAVVTVLELSERDAGFERARASFAEGATAAIARIIEEARSAGHIAVDLDTATAVDMLYGPVASRVFFTRVPIDHGFVPRVVDAFLLAHRP